MVGKMRRTLVNFTLQTAKTIETCSFKCHLIAIFKISPERMLKKIERSYKVPHPASVWPSMNRLLTSATEVPQPTLEASTSGGRWNFSAIGFSTGVRTLLVPAIRTPYHWRKTSSAKSYPRLIEDSGLVDGLVQNVLGALAMRLHQRMQILH